LYHLVKLNKPKKILEIGSEYGHLPFLFKIKPMNHLGIDYSDIGINNIMKLKLI